MIDTHHAHNSLRIEHLNISVGDKQIVEDLNLEIKPGEVHALMGPNGSGKSTLANTLMGHPKYTIKSGQIFIDDTEITTLSPDKRAKKGLFLSFQYPQEIAGVTLSHFLRTALNAHREKPISVLDFHKLLKEKMQLLNMDPKFANRYVNEGFSGGEKKKAEILQMAILEPKFAILDETDSGLDVDALRAVTDAINVIRGPHIGILLITHYTRILNYIQPDFVHVLSKGKLVKTGTKELAHQIEEGGYASVL